MPVKVKRKLKSEEHDAQCDLFKGHIWPRLVAGAVASRSATAANGIRKSPAR
jgi:hypothetical protein